MHVGGWGFEPSPCNHGWYVDHRALKRDLAQDSSQMAGGMGS